MPGATKLLLIPGALFTVNVNPPVPPEPLKVNTPLPPLHNGFVPLAVTATALGSEIVTAVCAEHPLASVATTT